MGGRRREDEGKEGGRNKEKNITLNVNQTYTCTGEKIQSIHCPRGGKCVTVLHVCSCQLICCDPG